MSTPSLAAEIHYPESDGQPMAETQLHQDWMVRLIDILRVRYAQEQVYVAGNMFLYYVEGEVGACVAPDVFVVKGIAPISRRIYQLWNEGHPPNVVFETTSAATRTVDLTVKSKIYASIGVAEYFLYDPTADYLEPPLQGHRLTAQGYVRLEPNMDGQLESEQLDVFLERQGLDLVLRDRKTGRVLETRAEIAQREAATIREVADRERAAKNRERAAKERERAEKMRERAAREAAELESEVHRQQADRERAAREAAELESEARRQQADRERTAREAAEQAIAALSERIREMEQALARQQVAPPLPKADPESG